jgi:endonuclease-3
MKKSSCLSVKEIMSQYSRIKEFRKSISTIVDVMGCDAIFQKSFGTFEEKKFLLLTSLLLSVQTTDIKTFKIMEKVYEAKLTPAKVKDMSHSDLELIIQGTNYGKKKAVYIKDLADYALNKKLPETLEEVVKLKGIGYKIGNIYIQTAFKTVEGIAVDTHCHRYSTNFY